MARKTLLTESEIRSFLKLADLNHIADDRIHEMYGTKMPGMRSDDEDDMKEEEDPMADMADDDAMPGMADDAEAGMDDAEMGMDDAEMGMDADMGAAEAGPGMISIEDFMGALEAALEDVTGQPVETEVDMEDDAMDDDGMDDAGMDDDMPGMDDAMPGMDDDDDMDAPAPMMEEEEVVNEVARRVAARLQAKNNKTEMVDQLAERILSRLTSK
tara:strand:- start:848 stop:1489 length:642 start_codon:yes stop_codon:yes gene_type:complete